MALTSVTNTTAGTQNQAGQQKVAESAQQKGKTVLSGQKDTGNVGDTVTLSQSEKISAAVANIDESQVGEVLPRTKSAILQNSKAALASQANVNAFTAKEILAEA